MKDDVDERLMLLEKQVDEIAENVTRLLVLLSQLKEKITQKGPAV